MKKIDKFLLKSFVGPLVMTFFIATFILLVQFIWRYMDDLIGKGLPLADVMEFLWYACWTFVPMSLPLAVLLSSLMVYGNLGEHYELVAFKSAGIPIKRVMRSSVALSVVIGGIAFYFANNAVPTAYKLHRQKYHELQTTRPAVNLQEGVYYYGIPDYVIRVGKKADEGRYLENVQIYDHSERKGNRAVTMSERGSMYTLENGRYLVFNLFDGWTYGEDAAQATMGSENGNAENPFTRIKFDTQTLIMDLSEFDGGKADENMYGTHQKSLGLKALGRQIDTLKQITDKRVADLVSNLNGRSYYLSYMLGADSLGVSMFSAAWANPGFQASYVLPQPTPAQLKDAYLTANSMAEDMSYYKRDIFYQHERLNSYRVEEHKKFSLSVGCLILFLIGAPLGALIRKGGMGTPVVVSVIMFIVYYMLSVIGEKAAIEGSISCTLGAWISTFLYLPLGVFLALQVTLDSSLLDADTWRHILIRNRKRG